ncbi:MAG TPA: alpha/beta fold hydrolase [Candidatus Binatia bacterium]|nr:alpha/beta fold hydrolase [Candidatus Binatia bacterium]
MNPAAARGRGAALLLLALITTPARALDFAPCAETGHEAFDCATLPVPIDRDGSVPGSIDLHVERQRGKDWLPVLVSVAGGPGYSSTAYRPKDDLKDLGYDVQLVVVDQRGTGRSGALESVAPACRTLDDRLALRRCDEALGPAGAFYRTADSVLDLEAVRASLGVERLIVLGVSYGTFLAAEYARRFPDRVQALVLDSPVGPEGGDRVRNRIRRRLGRPDHASPAGFYSAFRGGGGVATWSRGELPRAFAAEAGIGAVVG